MFVGNVAVLVVYDPTDEQAAKTLVDAIQPHLGLPVRTASHVAEAEQEAKNAEVALLLISKKLEDNWELIEAVAKILPNSLVPILIDEAMANTKDWMGALAWYISDNLFINFCKPTKDAADWVMTEALAAKGRAAGAPGRRSFHAFLSHEWGKDKRVHKMAIELALRLRDHDIDVWLDAQQVSGSIHGSMADGIDSSTVFLVLATKGYMEKINTGDRSDNCLKEFQYAGNKRFDSIVVAALEEDMIKPATGWTGRFQLALTRQAPVDLTECSNGSFSDEAIERLANAIHMRIETPEASSDLTPLMRDIYPRLNPCSSEAWAKGKAENFTLGTRSWIIDEFCDWYNKKQSAVFILVGDGGVGKSVIMAELCHRGGALLIDGDVTETIKDDGSVKARRKSSRVRSLWRRGQKERQPIFVAAYHFFRHDQVTTAAPKEALLSIAWQLCLSVPGFADVLDSESFGGIRDKPLADVFQIILVNPANKLGPDQMRQVVVLDALDECSKSDDVLRKVIRAWKDVMPAWLSLVVSTRPEGEIQRGITNNSLDSKVLELKDEENFRDIEKHIEHLLCDMKDTVEQKDVASCAKILSERSEGLFLWASFLPETLNRMHEENQGGLLTLQDISHKDAIPNGLGGMFHEYFERLRDKMSGDAYQLLLTPIVAAREPLSVEQLTVILGKTKNKTKKIIDNARNLLYKGGDGRVALIHKRMADWLVDFDQSGDLGVDLEDGHVALAKYCSSSRDHVFSLRHAVFHLVKSGKHDEAFELLNDFAWVQSAISVGDNEAQRRATIGNLIRDCVELGIYFAPESDTPRFLSKAVHALSYDPNELASQVLARFGNNSKDPLANGLQPPDRPWLRPVRVTLAHPRDPLQHAFRGHTAGVGSVVLKGNRIVSGSWDNTARIWNATSGEEQHVLKGHSGPVLSVAIQRDTIVSGSDDHTVRIWNANSGETQHILKGHADEITSVAIKSNVVVSGSRDMTVRTWNAMSGETQHLFRGHDGAVKSVAIEGNTVVSGSDDTTVRTWSLSVGKEQHVLHGHAKAVNSVGKEQHVLHGHAKAVNSVAIEDNTIVSGSDDNTVRIWCAISGKENLVLKGHSSEVKSVAIQAGTIVSGSLDKTLRTWSAGSGEPQRVLTGHSLGVNSVAIEGDSLVSGSADNLVHMWNTLSGEKQHLLKGHSDVVKSVAVEGDIIVTGSDDGTVRSWSATSGKEQHIFKGHSGQVNSVAIAGGCIVSGSADQSVRVWNAESGQEEHVLEGHSGPINCVVIWDVIIVSGSADGTVRTWAARSGKEQHVLKGHSSYVICVAIEANTIVSASADKTVRIWNARSGEEQHILRRHSAEVNVVAIGNGIVVSGSADKTACVWDVESGKEMHLLQGHSTWVDRVAVQGDTVVSQSYDRTRVWDVGTGEELNADPSNTLGVDSSARPVVVVSKGVQVRLRGGVGFTTDHAIRATAQLGNLVVIGDSSGMVHILRVKNKESVAVALQS